MRCYHCDEIGHIKSRCLERYVSLAMWAFDKGDVPRETIDAVKEAVTREIQKALNEGKSGDQLKFGGSPNRLFIEWPGRVPPPYPARGAWYAGTYYGDDG